MDQILRHQLDHLGIDLEILQIHGGDAVLFGEDVDQLLFVEQAQPHQGLPQPAAVLALILLGLFQIVGG